jgi:hypothetical protein
MDLVYTIAFNVPFVLHCLWLRNCIDLRCSVVCWTVLTCWVPYRLYAGRLPPSVVSVLILSEWNSRTVLHYTRRSSVWKPIFHYCVDSCVRLWMYYCRCGSRRRWNMFVGLLFISVAQHRQVLVIWSLSLKTMSTKRPKLSWEVFKLQRCNECNHNQHFEAWSSSMLHNIHYFRSNLTEKTLFVLQTPYD